MFNLHSINAMLAKPGERAVKRKENKNSIYYTPSAQSTGIIVRAMSLTEAKTVKQLMEATSYSYGAVLRVLRNLEKNGDVFIAPRCTNKPAYSTLLKSASEICKEIIDAPLPGRDSNVPPRQSSIDAVMGVVNAHDRIQLKELVKLSGKSRQLVNNVLAIAVTNNEIKRTKQFGLVFITKTEKNND